MLEIFRRRPEWLLEQVFSDQFNTRVLPAQHDDSSGKPGSC